MEMIGDLSSERIIIRLMKRGERNGAQRHIRID